jgi:hypothetical protein
LARKKSDADKKRAAAPEFNPEKSRLYLPIFILIILIGIVVLFSEFIFSNQMLFGSDTINAGIFFRHYYVEYVKARGIIPAWNPYIFGGLPFVDAFHGDIFYPFSVLKFVGNFYRMLGFNLVLHIFLAGIFMYFAARQFKLSKIASTVSGVGYMFSGLLVSFVAPGHDGKIFVTTLFPLTILFLDRAFERKPVLNFSLLGLVIGIIILSPHPQLSYYTLWSLAFYGLFKLVDLYVRTKSVGKVIKPASMLVAAVVIGLFISAIQFYPGYIYTKNYSPRADTKTGYEWATSWSMGEEEAVSLIVPEFSGTNSGTGNYYWGKNIFKDNSEYAGVISLFLAFIATFFYRKKEAMFFSALALFAFIYALGGTTPIFKIFYYLIPNVKSLRAPSTIMFVFLFSVSLLAGMGVQYLIDKGRHLSSATRKRLAVYLITVPAVFFILALLFSAAGESMLSVYSSIFYGDIQSMGVGQGMTKWNMALLNLPNIETGVWIVFLLLTAVAGVILLFVKRKVGVAVLLVIPLLMMVDGVRFDKRFIKTFDHRTRFTPNALTDYLKNRPGKPRVFDLQASSQDYLPYFGIDVVTGYHGNQLRWYDDLIGGMRMKNRGNPNFLNLVGAKYLLAPKSAQIPVDYFGKDSLVREGEFGDLAIYRNDNAFPRAFLVDEYEVVPDRQDIYPRVVSAKTDNRRKAFLEKEPGLEIQSADSVAAGTARIISYADDSVLVECNTTKNSLLILTDNYYHRWQAFADGNQLEVLRAYGSFRAVPIKAGTKTVLFKYDRAGNSVPRAVTLLTLALVGIILVIHLAMYLKEKKKVVPAT